MRRFMITVLTTAAARRSRCTCCRGRPVRKRRQPQALPKPPTEAVPFAIVTTSGTMPACWKPNHDQSARSRSDLVVIINAAFVAPARR